MEGAVAILALFFSVLFPGAILVAFWKRDPGWKRPFRTLEADFEELQERVNYSLGRISRLRGLQKRGTGDSPGEQEQPGGGTTVSVPAPATAGLPNLRSKLYAAHLRRRKHAISDRSGNGEPR